MDKSLDGVQGMKKSGCIIREVVKLWMRHDKRAHYTRCSYMFESTVELYISRVHCLESSISEVK